MSDDLATDVGLMEPNAVPTPQPELLDEPRRGRGRSRASGSPRREGTTPAAPPPYVTRPVRALAPLSRTQIAVRAVLLLLVVTQVGFLLHLTVYSHLRHAVLQAQLRAQLTSELADGIAPVSEGTFDNVLLDDGAPVARISIPAIGVDEIVVEGTSSVALQAGPGHRRDTVLPGQIGTSVLMGRASAYGGPFGRIQELAPGETISVVTGQGEALYKVIGVRYAGDPAPPSLVAGHGRLTLLSGRGIPYFPNATVRVDADLVSTPQPIGARQTTSAALPAAHKAMASDTSTVWMLVFGLQFLLLAELGVVFAWNRFGRAKTWIAATPVLILAFLIVFDQVTKLLPNLT